VSLRAKCEPSGVARNAWRFRLSQDEVAARRSAATRVGDDDGVPAPELLTVGHSTHPVDEFVALLRGAEVEAVADVRRFPGSRRHPQFGREALSDSLRAAAIEYTHLPELGGRRPVAKDSRNDGWTVAGFRGYADHLRTAEFAEGRAALERLATARRTAVMCAEAQWWRCHRRLIADVFTFAGWRVLHLMPDGRLTQHEPPPFAIRAPDGLPRYPAARQPSLLDG
jgi:uncharacterized protein DUF488